MYSVLLNAGVSLADQTVQRQGCFPFMNNTICEVAMGVCRMAVTRLAGLYSIANNTEVIRLRLRDILSQTW